MAYKPPPKKPKFSLGIDENNRVPEITKAFNYKLKR